MHEPTSTVLYMRPEKRPKRKGVPARDATRRLELDFDTFTREALERESLQLGVSVEELTTFAVLYYLADRDSGRIARRPPPLPPEQQHTASEQPDR